MATIQLENLVKAYGEVEVLHKVNGEIKDGELVVVVGPSGCGKSTLLRMIAGLETVTSGNVSIGARVVNDLEPAERDIAMVFQNYALYPHMSVRQNMAYGLKIRRINQQEIERRVNQAAEILSIEEYLDRKPRQLSGGQRQRVAMGRAIVRDPQVFLFDEPLSNLDAKLRVQMRLEIRKLQQRLNVTSIYVTHDQVEAMTLGDRLMVLNDGVVEQFGTPIDLYDKPETIFVAGFIGSPRMNLHSKESLLRAAKKNSLALDEKFPNHAVIGVRPENINLQDADQNDLYLGLGTIQRQEDLGHEILAQLMTESGLLLTVRTDGKIRHQNSLGDKVPISVSLKNVHAFSAEAGKRLT